MEYGSTEQILYRGWRGVGGTMVPDAGVGSGPLVNGDDLIWAVRIKTKKMQFTIGTQLGVFQRVLSFGSGSPHIRGNMRFSYFSNPGH
jgi:hypothetical protein